MNRRIALFAPLALALLGTGPARADLSLAQISAYLNGLTTAEADFTQVSSDGAKSAGRLFIQRPNRMRFEYKGRDAALVLASAGSVAVFDPKSNQPPEQYPLRRTPLGLILGPKVDLERARMVVAHGPIGDQMTVTAQDPDHPEYGTIRLYFSQSPIALTQWVVTDDAGGQTLVRLGPLQTGASYPSSLFDIEGETERRASN